MLTMESTLVRVDEMKSERVEGIKKATKAKLLETAEKAMGVGTRLVIRDLLPTDLGYDNNEFILVTGVNNTWTSILKGIVEATVADNVFVAIIGCRILAFETTPFDVKPAITAMKFTVGGSVVAEWDLHKLIAIAGATSGAGSSVHVPTAGITEGPIIIGQNITFNIQTYGVETTVVQVAIDGYTCEKEGQTLKP